MEKDIRQTPVSCKPASAPSQSQVTGLNAHGNVLNGNGNKRVARPNASNSASVQAPGNASSVAPAQSQVTGLNTASTSSTSASPALHAAPHAPSRSQIASPHATQPENSTSRSQTASPHAAQPAHAPQPGNSTQPPQPAAVGTFTCLYESKDKKYCLFADENGHLTSVKAHRLS